MPTPAFFPLRGNRSSFFVMATEQSQNENCEASRGAEDLQKQLDELLKDPTARMMLLQKLNTNPASQSSAVSDGSAPMPYLTPSGTAVGSGWPVFPVPFPFAPTTGFPPFWGQHAAGIRSTPHCSSEVGETSTASLNNTESDSDPALPGASGLQEQQNEEVVIEHLSETEALEMLEFDPKVASEEKWVPLQSVATFLEKHFKRCLSSEEQEAILKDFPKPDCPVLEVPTLDEPVRDPLKRKGKDPHFGSEKTLYKLQGQVLDLAGPLTCLWADLLNADAKVKREDVLLLVQRILVLLGSVSNSITQERRQISWSRLNPLIKDFYLEEEDKGQKGTTLFGGGFLEKATKRVEEDKALAKVTGGPKDTPSAKRRKYSQDPRDLRRFLDKGTPAWYSGGKQQRQQLYNRYHNSRGGQNSKYPQQLTGPKKQSKQ